MIFNVKSIQHGIHCRKRGGRDEKTERTTDRRKQDEYRTNIADRGSSNPQCVTAIREGSNAAGKLPIGTAVQMSSIWTYHISEKLLADYSGKNIEKEIERIRGGVEK